MDGRPVRFDLIPSNTEAPQLIFDLGCFYWDHFRGTEMEKASLYDPGDTH